MTRDEASARAAKLSVEHPQREQFRWLARQGDDGDWTVVRVRLPKPAARERFTVSEQGKQPAPPDEHPLDLPGGLPPWGVGPS